MKKETIILFDLDGTLIDSTEAILESFGRAFAQFGTTAPSEEAIKAEIGHPLDVMFQSFGVERSEVWAHVDAYKAHYRKISRAKTVLLPEAREAVVYAASFALLGVVTTKTARYSVELLAHMDLMDYFEVLIGREDVVHPKPHPEPIEKALAALPTVTGKRWMIGDTCMDMQCAKEAKVAGVAVSCGYGSVESLMGCSENMYRNALQAVQFIAKR